MRLSSLTETASIKKNDSITLEGTITTVENQITAWNTITCYVLILDYPIQFKIDDGAWIYDSNKYLCESVQVDSNAEPYVGKRVSVTGIISFAQLKVDVEDIVLQNCTYELLSGYGASKFFSEPKYIADIWLNQNGKSDTPESRFLDMLLGFDSVSGTMYYELLNDPGFQAGLAGWDGFKAVFDSVEYADQVMSETEVYTTLIFDLLRAVAEENNEEINNVVLDAMDTTGTAGKTVTKHKGYIDNFVSIVDSPAEGLLEVLKEWKFKGSDCQSFQNFYSNLNNINDDYSIWNNNKFIKGIGEIAEIAEDVSDFYAKFTGYLYAVDMAEEMQTLLREMRKYASGNMYTALGDVLNAVGNADYIAAVMTMDLGKDIIVDVADEVFKEVAKCFPEYYALQKAYQAAVAFDNLVFNTSEIRDNYYLIKASTEFIESNKKAVLSLAAKYRQSGSEADAGAYVYATRAYHHAYIIDTDSAASFIKAADDEGAVNQVRKTFMYAENLITGSNNKTNYQQFMESKESTERILKSQFRWLDNSWKFNETYLKTDYPEIFPIYLSEELSSEDYATYVDAYIATSGNTELNWEIPWGFRDEEDNIQILYASTLINGITATETINGVSDVKDYNPEYFSDIPNPIVFSNQSKFSTFPKKYSVVSYSTSTGEKVYTTPVDETLENPIKKVTIEIPMNQLSGSVWQNNGITFWIIDRSNSRYQNIVYDVYRSTDGSSWQKIGSSSRQSDSAWFFAGKTSTGFCDESAAEGHTYSYKVISSFNFGNGKTLRSPESQVFAVTKSAGTALAPASVRLMTGGTGSNNSGRPQPQAVSEKDAKGTYYQVSWPAMGNATKYEVYRLASYGKLYKKVATVSGTVYNDYNVSDGVEYDYIIIPIETNTSGTGASTSVYNTSFYAEGNSGLINRIANAVLSVGKSTTVDYRTDVTLTAFANNIPDGYYLAVYEGDSLKETGTNNKVSFRIGEMRDGKTYTVKVVDENGTVQKDGNGKELSAKVEIKVKTGFFSKLIAFFRWLFSSLPSVEIKPSVENPDYKLTYDANGGTNAPSPSVGTGDINLSFTAPKKVGCTFLGWSTYPGATTANYQPGAVFNLTADTTLYAVWKKIDPNSFTVYVAIADSSKTIQLAYEPINVYDIDSDGKYTISDALYCAHEQYYPGGAAAGYESKKVEGYDGLSPSKLWGETNYGAFGYYLNDSMAWSLTDVVKENDCIYAYTYSDIVNYTDTYAYFDKKTVESEEATEVELTLSMLTWKSDYSAQEIVPVKGAEITINGEKTGVRTDANGKATIQIPAKEKVVVSAVSPDGENIVPPVCRINITPS